MSEGSLSYKDAGVDIDVADATKQQMKKSLETTNSRVLNRLGAFASLIDINYPELKSPVMVMKMEEPGSKQLLAAQHGRLSSVGFDLVNHLINDTIMMGARPVAVQDTIICGNLEKDVVVGLVDAMAEACRAQDCDLVGGETSEQPRVIPNGSYILSAACVGLVDKEKIIDGSLMEAGDVVLAVASNGVHTNGYTLIRSLLDRRPEFAQEAVGDSNVLDEVLKPHLCYNNPLQKLFQETKLHGLAHVTGGGVVDNTKRIVPQGRSVTIDLSSIQVLPVFKSIAKEGNVSHDDMLRTFNMGVGMVIVCPEGAVASISDTMKADGFIAYRIGTVADGEESIVLQGELDLG